MISTASSALLLDDLLVYLHIVLRHNAGGEMLLNIRTQGLPIDLIQAGNELDHLIESFNQEACFTMHNDFWCGPALKGNDRAIERHGLDHNNTEWLLTFNRFEEAASAAQ